MPWLRVPHDGRPSPTRPRPRPEWARSIDKAAYNMLTAKGPDGKHLFDPRTVAALFHIALTQHLSRTSGFLDSRRGVELAARSLLRRDPMKNRKIDALGKALDHVGITAEDAGARVLS